MNNNIELSVVLPAYAEEENLMFLLPRLSEILRSLKIKYEILVIDSYTPLDYSKDVCKKFDAIHINRMDNNSFGSAIRTGIEKSKGKYIIFMDADGSHSPEFINKLYEKRCDNCVVIASRYIDGGHTDNSKLLVFMSKILNLIYAITLRLKINDISNNYKMYDSVLLKKLKLNCNNFDIVEEIIYKIVRQNKKVNIIEIPYTFKKRIFGHTKRNLLLFIIMFIFTLIRLILSDQKTNFKKSTN